MPLSTEIFVMAIFIAGAPFFHFLLRDSDLPGRTLLMWAYILLMFSNIFTVVEEFCLNAFFNACEHASITLGSIMILGVVTKLTGKKDSGNRPRISDDKGPMT